MEGVYIFLLFIISFHVDELLQGWNVEILTLFGTHTVNVRCIDFAFLEKFILSWLKYQYVKKFCI